MAATESIQETDSKSSTTSKESKLQPEEMEGKADSSDDVEDMQEVGNMAFLTDTRVAFVGNVDAGKSSLIGTLTSGILDDGRGLARSRVFQHAQEKRSGRTSSISQHLLGFDENSKVVTQPTLNISTPAQKSRSWRTVLERSKSVMTFIDLAGHRRYLKTTVSGLAGCYPDFAVVMVNGLQGVKGMTGQHISICQALRIPIICVVTKVDICPRNVLAATHKQLFKILKSSKIGKTPIQIKNPGDVEICIQNMTKPNPKVVPVFYISSVRGTGLGLLQDFLSGLRPRSAWKQALKKPARFVVDTVYHQVAGVGIVLAGTVSQGILRENDSMFLGPFGQDGHFVPVTVRSLQYKRSSVPSCPAGNSCSVAFRMVGKRGDVDVAMKHLRKGMVLCTNEGMPPVSRFFDSEVVVFHHPTTISTGYQAVVHLGIARQAAMILKMDRECLRSRDQAMVRFAFLQRPEVIVPGTVFVFREGNTKGIGRVTRALVDYKGIGHELASTSSTTGSAGGSGSVLRGRTHWFLKGALKRFRAAGPLSEEDDPPFETTVGGSASANGLQENGATTNS